MQRERRDGVAAAKAVIAESLRCSIQYLPQTALNALELLPSMPDDVACSALGFWLLVDSWPPDKLAEGLAMAAYGHGLFEATLSSTSDPRARRRLDAMKARIAAEARHVQNRAMRQKAVDAYLKGDFRNKDCAAESIAGNVVTAKYRTVRDWLKGVAK